MPLLFVRSDITAMAVDAIVNAANETLLGGGGVDGAIHRAAGPQLLAECRTLGGCRTGEAKITGAYRLPCRYVIHTVGPVWHGGGRSERKLLVSAYRSSLELAAANDCETVAFPLISAGAYGYPKEEALRVAVETIGEFLLSHEMTVSLVIFDRSLVQLERERFPELAALLGRCGGEEESRPRSFRSEFSAPRAVRAPAPADAEYGEVRAGLADDGLLEALSHLDESFSEMLLRKIDESGMTDAQCYKKANIDRKLFSKIRSDRLYRPSKPTALAFAVALGLSLEETGALLRAAGFALSGSSRFDVIVSYFISRGHSSVLEINEALFAFDQVLLGG